MTVASQTQESWSAHPDCTHCIKPSTMDVDANDVRFSQHFDALGGVTPGWHVLFVLHGRRDRTPVYRVHLHMESGGEPVMSRRDRWTGLQELNLPAERSVPVLRSYLASKPTLREGKIAQAPRLPEERTERLLGGADGWESIDRPNPVIRPGMLLVFGDANEGHRYAIELPVIHIYQLYLAPHTDE